MPYSTQHAVFPGTFAPITPGHLDIIERARRLFPRITVLVAVNGDKQQAGTQAERAIQVRREIPGDWENVSVTGWDGLTGVSSTILRGLGAWTDAAAAPAS